MHMLRSCHIPASTYIAFCVFVTVNTAWGMLHPCYVVVCDGSHLFCGLCLFSFVMLSSKRGTGIRIEYARQRMGTVSVCTCVR